MGENESNQITRPLIASHHGCRRQRRVLNSISLPIGRSSGALTVRALGKDHSAFGKKPRTHVVAKRQFGAAENVVRNAGGILGNPGHDLRS